MEPSTRRVQVFFAGVEIASTDRAFRVLETSHPPVFYIPPADVRMELMTQGSGSSFCEYKGAARYYDLSVGERTVANAAWYYPRPSQGYEVIRDQLAFYPGRVDRCVVDGELVRPQAGAFYGGWITDDVTGPFKGEPGTSGW